MRVLRINLPTHTLAYTQLPTHTRLHTLTYTHTPTHTRLHTHAYTHSYTTCKFTSTRSFTHLHTPSHIICIICIYKYTYIHLYLHLNICINDMLLTSGTEKYALILWSSIILPINLISIKRNYATAGTPTMTWLWVGGQLITIKIHRIC